MFFVFFFFFFWEERDINFEQKCLFIPDFNRGGYRKQIEHTSGGLSDTFQTTGRQSDFRPNHRWVMCNYLLFFLNRFFLFSFNFEKKKKSQNGVVSTPLTVATN